MNTNEQTPLEYQIAKQIPYSPDYYLARLKEFPENEWLAVTNSTENDPRGNSFSIFDELYGKSLVAKRICPLWRDGSFAGQRIRFLYRHDLNYRNLE